MAIKKLEALRIGVLGGGQLGRMLQQEASTMGIKLHFLDKSKDFPAGQLSHDFVTGSFNNYDDVVAFGSTLDLITIEIENVNTEALAYLESKGKLVYPQAKVIDLIKDKGKQKLFYKEHDIPSSIFELYADKEEIITAISQGKLSYPFVQKSRLAGYDGKGVAVIKDASENAQIMDVPSVIEDLVEITKELAVIVARNAKGETNHFQLTEMVFNQQGNLLDYLLCPALESDHLHKKCTDLALDVIQKLDMVGILAVELFLTKTGDILVNEVAPRPHNSGHHTINANVNSQFNLHLRSILNLGLGDTQLLKPAAMVNLLGEADANGEARYEGLDDTLKVDGVYVHIYGKKKVKPLRKMGHLTILADSTEELKEKIAEVKSKLKVKAWPIK